MAAATTVSSTFPCLGPVDRGRSLSLDEYLAVDFVEGYRYELARGVLEVSNIPGEPHALIVCCLICALADYRREHPGVLYRFGGAGESRILIPGLNSGRHPDVAVLLRGTRPDVRGQVRPAWAIEVVSAGVRARRRDYETKRAEYLAYGLLEYWIVDRFERKVTVLTRDGDAWSERVFHGDEAASGRVLPDFAVPLPALWAAAVDAPEPDEADALED